jgi:hypothetical protein
MKKKIGLEKNWKKKLDPGTGNYYYLFEFLCNFMMEWNKDI